MKRIKIFLDIATDLQPWINSWAEKGFRLVDVNRCIYTFERTEKRFKYAVQFIGANSYKNNKQYIDMLKESNLNVFLTSINQLSINYGKVRFRPYVEGIDKISSPINGYNKEILIVEMYEDEFVELLTDKQDLILCYSGLRKAYMQGLISIIALFIFMLYNINFYQLHFKEIGIICFFLVLIFVLFRMVYRVQKKILEVKNR